MNFEQWKKEKELKQIEDVTFDTLKCLTLNLERGF